jgi:hypothetical protein
MPKVVGATISGAELRRRLDALGPGNYVEAAQWLGLTRDGLEKVMTGKRTVSRQTQIILELRELIQNARDAKDRPRGKTRSSPSAQ